MHSYCCVAGVDDAVVVTPASFPMPAILFATCCASLPMPWIIVLDAEYRKCGPTKYSPGSPGTTPRS
jgi:hypothetical protein